MALDFSKIDVIDMLDRLGLENVSKATEREIRFSCPYPAHATGDASPSAYMNIYTTAFYCHGCKERGDARTLVTYVLGCSPIKAGRWLREAYDPKHYDLDSVSMVAEVARIRERNRPIPDTPLQILEESRLDAFAVDWSAAEMAWRIGDAPVWVGYMIDEREFDVSTLERFEIGFDEHTNRIVIPVRDPEGKLVGFKARSYNPEARNKYLNLGDTDKSIDRFGVRYGFAPHPKAKVVYNMHRAKRFTDIIICEGEFNAQKLDYHGFENSVSVNGSDLSRAQAKIIRELADGATIFFDSDEAGYRGTYIVADALKQFMTVRVVPDHDGDPDDMAAEEIHACIDQSVSFHKLALQREA